MGNCCSLLCSLEPKNKSESICESPVQVEVVEDSDVSSQHERSSTPSCAHSDSVPPENFRGTPFNLGLWTWPPSEKWKANLMQYALLPELNRPPTPMDTTWDSHSTYQSWEAYKLLTAHTSIELVPMPGSRSGSLEFTNASDFEQEEEAGHDAPYDEYAEGIPVSGSSTGLYTGTSNSSIIDIYMNSRTSGRLNYTFP